jgi:hypothetical protein
MTIVRRRRHEAGFHGGFRLRLSDTEKPGVNPAPRVCGYFSACAFWVQDELRL